MSGEPLEVVACQHPAGAVDIVRPCEGAGPDVIHLPPGVWEWFAAQVKAGRWDAVAARGEEVNAHVERWLPVEQGGAA